MISKDVDDIWLAYERYVEHDLDVEDTEGDWQLFEYQSIGSIAWNYDANGGSDPLVQDLIGYLQRVHPNGVPEELEIKVVRYTLADHDFSSDSIDVIAEMKNDS